LQVFYNDVELRVYVANKDWWLQPYTDISYKDFHWWGITTSKFNFLQKRRLMGLLS